MQYIGVSTKMYLGYQVSLNWMTQVRQIADAWEADACEADNRGEPGSEVAVRPFVIPSFLSRCWRAHCESSPARACGSAHRTAAGETEH